VQVRLPKGLTSTPWLDDVVDVAVPVRHRLASREVIDVGDLARDTWVTWDRRSICHDWLVHALRSRGHEPVMDFVAGEPATQLALVAAGLCVCVIPRLGQDPLPRGVVVKPMRPTLRRKISTSPRRRRARLSTPIVRSHGGREPHFGAMRPYS
jgi:DNA-binding transcriptional LysR family regulator